MPDYYAVLSGPAFSVSYCVAGLFGGMMVDKVNRKTLLAATCLLWSLSTITSGLTSNFLVFAAMRFTLGMCLSITDPCSYSILGEYFPKRMRSTSNSIMNTASYLGAGVSSLLVILISKVGWRQSYFCVGALGVVLSILTFLLVKEPERGFQVRLEAEKKLQQ